MFHHRQSNVGDRKKKRRDFSIGPLIIPRKHIIWYHKIIMQCGNILLFMFYKKLLERHGQCTRLPPNASSKRVNVCSLISEYKEVSMTQTLISQVARKQLYCYTKSQPLSQNLSSTMLNKSLPNIKEFLNMHWKCNQPEN